MRLKELRLKTKLNQTQTAEKLGIPRINYNKYENEEVEPSIDTMKKIADYFNVSLDYLLEHDTPNLIDTSSFSETAKGCIFLIEKLNEANATILLGYATRLLQEQNKLID